MPQNLAIENEMHNYKLHNTLGVATRETEKEPDLEF